MKKTITAILILTTINTIFSQTENNKDYIEFDDRKNIVHGVYMGLTYHYGQINNEDAHFTTFKLAYVLNRKLEVGVAWGFFYSEQPVSSVLYTSNEVALIGGYTGLHLEPILFSNRFINVSFPVLIGGGIISVLDKKDGEYVVEDEFEDNENTGFFMLEPGVNILYNISRYVQIETGIRYRITGKYSLPAFERDNLNGFSVGAGIKLGIFNMGRRKRPIKDGFD